MTGTLRHRIVLTVAPLAGMLLVLGIVGTWLVVRLGQNSDAILRENYDSVRAMTDLSEAVERADRALAAGIRVEFDREWIEIESQYEIEASNLTILPQEPQLAARLREALTSLRAASEDGFRNPRAIPAAVSGPIDGGRRSALGVAREIRNLNETQMIRTSHDAREYADRSVMTFAMGTLVSLVLAGVTIRWLQRTILEPIRSVTAAATAIGAGELHQLVPVVADDEIGRLAGAFNAMSARLRAYRQTDRDRLSRVRQAAQATVDSFPDPVMVLDPSGRVEVANPAAQRLFGIAPPGDGPSDLWLPPESLRPAVEEALRTRRPSVRDSLEGAVTFRIDGEEHVWQPRIQPVSTPEGENLGIAVVLHDITRFRLLDRLKSDWVATVSHELKTPLTSVQLAVHVLLEEVVGPLEPKQVELLLEARENADRLLKLIRQLLALAKLEDDREALDIRPTEVEPLLRAALENAAARAEDKQIAASIDAPADLPSIRVDPVRFGQALNNLLDNAIAFTPPGGSVSLSARATESSLTLTVADTGIGIPAADLPHVFERFFRVTGREEMPGTGLGLAIVREAIEAHGGTIRCASVVGEGTTFTIALPVGK